MPEFVIPDLHDRILAKLEARAAATGRTAAEEAAMILGVAAHGPSKPFWEGWTGATIPYTELAEAKPGSTLEKEWNTYRREAGRLLAEGHEGHCALIKGETIVEIFDTYDRASAEGWKRFPREPHLVRPILSREPLLRAGGYNLPCYY